MHDRTRSTLAMLLALIGALLAGGLLLQHRGEPLGTSAVAQICGEAEDSGCDRVNQSRYAELGGVPLAGLGVVFYLGLASLALLLLVAPAELAPAGGKLLFLAAAAGLAADLVLLGIQAFAIGAYCKLCLATYAVNAGLLGLYWPRRTASAAPLGGPAARPMASALVIATLLATAFAWSSDGWLRERAARRQASLLGVPVAAPAPHTHDHPHTEPAPPIASAPPAPAGSVEALQAQVRKLQATLDDPQQLQQYLTQRGLDEYDASPVQALDLQVPVKGGDQAPLKVVEYSDLMCPACRNLALAFKDYIPNTQGRVAVYFKNYPLDQACNPSLQRTLHPGACELALGGLCAHEQGKFWEYHDRVFAQPIERAGRTEVLGFAMAAGLDSAKLQACLALPATRQKLDAQIAEGKRVGVQGTPTVLLNQKRIANMGLFMQLVERESQRLGLPPLATPPPPKRP